MADVVISGLQEQLFSIVQLTGIGRRVEEGVEKLSNDLAVVQAMLFDADQRQFVDESVRLWVDKVQDFCYEADGVLDVWGTEILKSRIEKEGEVVLPPKKVCFCIPSSYFCLPQCRQVVLFHAIALKIKKLNQKLAEITTDKQKYTFEERAIDKERGMTTISSSFVDYSEIYGRGEEKHFLLYKLLTQDSINNKSLEIIPVVGMGGIGKTTLAQLAFNDENIRSHFEETIWVHVGEPFDLIRIAKAIIESLTGSVSELSELESLLTCLKKFIQGKKFLLVLDDIWIEDWTRWEPLEGSFKHGDWGSRIVVTTRNKKVAIMMRATTHMICLDRLSDEACWPMFATQAFLEGDLEKHVELQELSREIVMKCKGIPLLVKALGRLLHSNYSKEDWMRVLNHRLWELSDVRQTVIAPLLLSYYDLPPPEKRCLLYCSLFPADFEIDRDDLIELWMSQGYLDGNKSYERGENLFKSLAMRSIFQNFENNFLGKITKCRMNEVMHESIQFVARNKCFMWEGFSSDEGTNQKYETTHHYTLLLSSGAQIPISVYQKKKLRTLFVMRSGISTPLSLNFLSTLASLWTLCLRGCGIEKLPGRIDRLMHLRYLNLSDNPNLENLPYQLCNLFSLQTLRLNGCTELRSLPKQMEKLVNLRHLYIDGCDRLEELPKGIGRLASLRILDVFIVPCDYHWHYKAMKLEDLNQLKHFQGSLRIRGIGNVEHAHEAEKAELWTKQNLVELELNFSHRTGLEYGSHVGIHVLDSLRPPTDLKSLEIKNYPGPEFSDWMLSLVALRRLVLNGCLHCETLPPLGKLPSLEILHIENMVSLKSVGVQFLGVETYSDKSEIESCSESFPELKELCFRHLHNWEEWSWSGIGYSKSSLTIMPLLHLLEISDCERLETLPAFLQTQSLQKLTITNCPRLDITRLKGVGEDWNFSSKDE